MLHQILDNLVMAIKTSGPQRSRVCLCGAVNIRSTLTEKLHDIEVTSSSRAPERRSTFYRLSVKGDTTGLLHTGATLVHQVLHHVVVTISAGEHQWGGPICLG